MTSIPRTLTPPTTQPHMPALWTEITEAVTIGGVKALQIAFYELEQLPVIMSVLTTNKSEPGAAANLLLQARRPNKKGRERGIVQENSASTALFHKFALTCPDLTRGLKRARMAELAGLSVYDTRLDKLCKAISKAALAAWGMELGWYGGRFKVLTAKQSTEKETRIAKNNVLGGLKRAECKRRISENKGLPASGTETHTITLFEGVVGEQDDSESGHEG